MYKTTWSRIQTSANSGCALCQLLVPDKESDKDDVVIRLRFGMADFQSISMQPVTPHGAQFMEIEIEDYEIEIGNNAHFFYTSSGEVALQLASPVKAYELLCSQPSSCGDRCQRPNSRR